MQQLSNMDASFLSLESPRTPMHIGCVWTFSTTNSEAMTFPRFKRHISSRLPISPIFRRRLSTVPMDIDRPYWIEDPYFDIDNHLKHIRIDDKNATTDEKGATQKYQLINDFFSQTLASDQPLWEMLFIESSKDDGEFSVLLKFHHAAVDGMSAEKILSGLLSPDKKTAEPLADNWVSESPSIIRMTSNKIRSLYSSPKEAVALTKTLSHSLKRSLQLRFRDKEQQPPHFFMSPKSPFNNEIKSTRHLSSAHLPLNTIKSIRKAHPDYTINDLVLAICSGALRKQLITQGQLPKSPLVAMAPVSKRAGSEGHQGNLISPMLVSLATDIECPVERLKAINNHALKAKEYNREVAMEQIINHLPAWSSAWATKAYTRLRVANKINPIFNLIITNVPGPRCPLYLDGAELKSMEGMAPIVDGMGLTLVITSYIDTLTVAITSTPEMATHAPSLVSYLHESLEELKQALVPNENLERAVTSPISTAI